MGAWDIYTERVNQVGTMRSALVEHAKTSIAQMIMDSPSCHQVTINGAEQHVSIVHAEKASIKTICSIPGEHLIHGGLVDFAGNMWIITDLDADNEIYDRGTMKQCNHLLRWISKSGRLIEKWSIIEDGTKYLIGEASNELMSIGDARIALTIAKDSDTVELCRGMRFLIDDDDSDAVLAYQITKPNKLYNLYNGEGIYRFILNEVQLIASDNRELRIADYTNWHPDQALDSDHVDSEQTVEQIVSDAITDAATPPSEDGGWI